MSRFIKLKSVFNRKRISLAFLLILAIWIAHYVSKNIDEFKNVNWPSWQYFVYVAVLALVGMWLRGLFLKLMVGSFGVKLTFKQSFGIMVVTAMGNYIAPHAGMGMRAAYLKKNHSFPYAYFLSTMMATYIIQFMMATIISLGCVIYDFFNLGTLHLGIFVLSAVVLLGCLVFVFVFPKIPKSEKPILRHIGRAVDGWLKIKQTQGLMTNLSLILLLRILNLSLILYFAFQAFDCSISYGQGLLVASLICFTLLLRITPGSIGIHEGVYVFGATLFGFSIAEGLLIGAFVRVINLAWIFILGPIFSYMLMNENKPK